MLFRFVTPELSKLDELDTEVLVATLPTDVRPCRGVLGLCDFRMGGRLSRLMRSGMLTGELGEVVMVPGKPLLTFDKLLVFGTGPVGGIDLPVFETLLRSFFGRLTRLKARVAVVELPGRAYGRIQANVAAQALVSEANRDWDCDAWTLIEDQEGRAVTEAIVSEQRRRFRREL